MKHNRWLFLFGLIVLVLSGCQASEEENKNDTDAMTIYTTVYPLQFITESIGGEYVQVHSVYPPGADEHTFEPSQRDMIELANADLFFYIGYGLEGFAQKAEATLKNQHVQMLAIGEMIEIETEMNHHHDEDDQDHGDVDHHHHDEEDHHHGDIDPHLWIDPLYMKEMAGKIYDALTTHLPDHQQTFEQNYLLLMEELDHLHQQFTDMVDKVERKEFIVSHAAYGYWEKRYGLEQISIAGISSTNEPSQRKLASIIDLINDKDIPYILYEQNTSSKLSDVVREATETDPLYIHNLSVLTEKDIDNQETYISLMEKNIQQLEKALNE